MKSWQLVRHFLFFQKKVMKMDMELWYGTLTSLTMVHSVFDAIMFVTVRDGIVLIFSPEDVYD